MSKNILELITPGEWEVDPNYPWRIYGNNFKSLISECSEDGYTIFTEHRESNAKVMAASKRMLDILSRLVKVDEQDVIAVISLCNAADDLLNELNK